VNDSLANSSDTVRTHPATSIRLGVRLGVIQAGAPCACLADERHQSEMPRYDFTAVANNSPAASVPTAPAVDRKTLTLLRPGSGARVDRRWGGACAARVVCECLFQLVYRTVAKCLSCRARRATTA
jgi:hypothetical protein